MKRELTDRYLKSLKPPENGRLEISDSKRPGLRFRLSAHGNAVWMYEKRVKGGKKRKHTLGTWPEPISLSDARAKALLLEVEAAQGVDRVEEVKARKLAEEAAKATLLTVEQALENYDRLHLVNLRTRKERNRQLRQSFEGHMHRPVKELSRQDLQKVVDAKASSGRPVYANRIRTALQAFTRWAWERGYIADNIGAGIPRATRETARDRVLSLSEVQEIWRATFEMGDLWGPFLRVLMLTCQRRGEVLGLEWSQVDFKNRRIVLPGSRTKNGKPHITHLADATLAELTALKERRGSSALVFTTTGRTPVSGVSKAKARIDGLLAGFEPWRLHDIRTAFATAMVEAGVPESVADRVLNHSASGSAPSAVARVYNRAEQLPQRAAALDGWADMVTAKSGEIPTLTGWLAL